MATALGSSAGRAGCPAADRDAAGPRPPRDPGRAERAGRGEGGGDGQGPARAPQVRRLRRPRDRRERVGGDQGGWRRAAAHRRLSRVSGRRRDLRGARGRCSARWRSWTPPPPVRSCRRRWTDRDWAVRVRARTLLAEQGVTGVEDAMRPAVAGRPVDSPEWQAIVVAAASRRARSSIPTRAPWSSSWPCSTRR